MRYALVILGCMLFATNKAQEYHLPEVALKWSTSIDSNDLKRHLFYLASDYLEGRETGSLGNNRAATYISAFMKKNQLRPLGEDYLQRIPFLKDEKTKGLFCIGADTLQPFVDYALFPLAENNLEYTFSDFYFAGYGIVDKNYNDLGEFDWNDKAALIYRTIPAKIRENLRDSTQHDFSVRIQNLYRQGVKVVFIIDDEFSYTSARIARMQNSNWIRLPNAQQPLSLPLAFLNSDEVEEILGSEKKEFLKEKKKRVRKGMLVGRPFAFRKAVHVDWQYTTKEISSQNILGYIEGSNPSEHIIVSAHYDHLGVRAEQVYNGADDNASGTTALLELIETFAQAAAEGWKPRRSIVFMFMTGEEKGLLGSDYYTQNPLLPLDDCMANVNIDMVGRVDEKYQDSSSAYIYVIGADRISQDLHDINEKSNQLGPQLILDYTYNAEDDPNRYYYRSDHYNFAKNGIPAIFYFNGTHKDYHRISDTPDKINYSQMEDRLELFFLTIWQLANRKEPLALNR